MAFHPPQYPMCVLADNYDEWWNVKPMADKKKWFKFQYDTIREPRQIWNADLREYHLCAYAPKVCLFYNPSADYPRKCRSIAVSSCIPISTL